MTAQNNRTVWQPKPLNRKGDLNGWRRRMQQACPNPKEGQIVYLDREEFDRSEGVIFHSRTGYKCLGFRASGDAIWQRGQTVRLPVQEAA
ncbi:hypothetical protein AB4524_00825 [Vibrio breoganii]